MTKTMTHFMVLSCLTLLIKPVFATEQVTYKSAKSTSSYYQMAVQYAEQVKKASNAALSVTIEESQGSVQNVSEVPRRAKNYLFTSPPDLIKSAQAGEKPFRENPAFAHIRALFPIPSLNMHFVVSEQSDVRDFSGLKGKKYAIGKGAFSSKKTKEVLEKLGVNDVDFVDIEINAAIPAMKNGQIDGFTTASAWPTPNVIEVATALPIRLLTPTADELAKLSDPTVTIPANTYKGVDYDTTAITLPVIVYTTDKTTDETAYQLTKTFWEGKQQLASKNRWWDSVDINLLNQSVAAVHPGALRYYEEAGMYDPASKTFKK